MAQMHPFIRYAAKSKYFIPHTVAAYDCRILYLLEGKCTFTFGTTKYNLMPNSILYYPAGHFYKIEADPQNPPVFYSLNFDFTQEYTHLPHAMTPVEANSFDIAKVLDTPPLPEFEAPVFLQNAAVFKEDIAAIVQEKEEKVMFDAQICSAHLQLVLYRLLRLKSNISPTETIFKRLVDYIRVHYHEPVNNTQIATALHYHPNYLNSVVRQITGMPFNVYLRAFRMNKATELLCSTHLSVQEIAERCGFVNANHFSVCYKKQTGVSPTDVRKASLATASRSDTAMHVNGKWKIENGK